MINIRLDHLSFSYYSEGILTDIVLELHERRVFGIVGPNGSGKSTLLQLITGDLYPDSGRVIIDRSLKIGYLPQEISFPEGRKVFQEVLEAHESLNQVEHELHVIEKQLTNPDFYMNERKLANLLSRQEALLETYVSLGGPGHEGRVRSLLNDLGFSEEMFDLPLDVLSGGQKKLIGLAKLMIMSPDILLLDEPDNHLDLVHKSRLEKMIREYPGTVLIVSHDRYLMDLVVDEIVEVENKSISKFQGNYSEYAYEKQQRLARQLQMYLTQNKEITRLEQSAKRLLTWGKIYDNEKFSKRGENILKRIDRIDVIDKPEIDKKKIGLQIQGWQGSRKVLEIKDLDKYFELDDLSVNILFDHVSLNIQHGERVGLIGSNGSGKSMLLKMVLGEEPVSGGEIILGPSIKAGYYAQHHDVLDLQLTLIELVQRNARLSESRTVAFLTKFLFTYEQATGKIKDLSGGERSRLQLALMMLSGANFLILDEPTNHLDIPSSEVLEDVLVDFEGTVLVVSHDRYFLDRIVNRIIEIDHFQLAHFPGNFSDYVSNKS